MVTPTAVVPDVDAEIRWRDWQAKAAASDRRAIARMRVVVLLTIAALVIVWLGVRLT